MSRFSAIPRIQGNIPALRSLTPPTRPGLAPSASGGRLDFRGEDLAAGLHRSDVWRAFTFANTARSNVRSCDQGLDREREAGGKVCGLEPQQRRGGGDAWASGSGGEWQTVGANGLRPRAVGRLRGRAMP